MRSSQKAWCAAASTLRAAAGAAGPLVRGPVLGRDDSTRVLVMGKPPCGPVTPYASRGARFLRPCDQRAQAEVLLVAGGAALEMRSQPRDLLLGIRAGDLELDVAVELLEALVAGHLGAGGPQQASQESVEARHHRVVPPPAVGSSAKPSASRRPRSFRRASWIVLYSAPRVVPRRSARTSMGTPLSATATRTSRWWSVSSESIASRTASSSSACSTPPSADELSAASGQCSGASGSSRPCHGRRRSFTEASSSANL